jgi:hypothetical protein
VTRSFLWYSLALVVFVSVSLTTASNRKNTRSNTNREDLLPHDIFTYGTSVPAAPISPPSSVPNIKPVSIMTTNSFLHTLQTSAINALSPYTGDSSQRVTEFVAAVEHIGGYTNLDPSMLHSLSTSKLDGPALRWYFQSRDSLSTWST